jgi:hypothetical protein
MKKTLSAKNCCYYLIRLGKGGKDAPGDFIDHIDYKYNISVIQFPDAEILAIQGPSIKFFIEKDAWTLPVESMFKKIGSDIPKNILMGLYQSAFDGNDGGLVIHECLNEDFDNFFQTTDQDDIAKFGDCYFGICSVTRDLEFEVNPASGETTFNGKIYSDISDLYGHFDEDEGWVVGISN